MQLHPPATCFVGNEGYAGLIGSRSLHHRIGGRFEPVDDRSPLTRMGRLGMRLHLLSMRRPQAQAVSHALAHGGCPLGQSNEDLFMR